MLDINTPKGQETLVQVSDAVEVFTRNFPSYEIIKTMENDSAAIDFIIHDRSNVIATAEIKCRNMDYATLSCTYGNNWLITFEKVLTGVNMSRIIKRPFYGFLYLVPDKMLLTVKITDNKGNIVAPMNLMVTTTQANVNGGKADRTNAYINMQYAKILI